VTFPALADRPPPYGTVVFDCDSTLSAMEGVEELAGPHAAELAAMTGLAMDGRIALEEVYARRLELVRPSRAQVEEIGRLYVERSLPHAAELVAALQRLGKRVRIVSGGLHPAVLALARALGIPDRRVDAVELRWDESGAYAGFDADSPLCRSGGKLRVLERIRAEPDCGELALVGDGVTDLEAAPLAARFVAFGGVVRREPVFAAARVRCESADLADLLALLVTPAEREQLRAHPDLAPLLHAAERQP
jgi:phosphoserine phosphatase